MRRDAQCRLDELNLSSSCDRAEDDVLWKGSVFYQYLQSIRESLESTIESLEGTVTRIQKMLQLAESELELLKNNYESELEARLAKEIPEFSEFESRFPRSALEIRDTAYTDATSLDIDELVQRIKQLYHIAEISVTESRKS